jgi:hypothetical protein
MPDALRELQEAGERLGRRAAPGLLLIIREPQAFGFGEAFRCLFGLKAEDGLVVVDGYDDGVSGRSCRRIASRRYLNLE